MVFPSDLEIARGAALKPLEDIADAMGIASHLLHHLTKREGGSPQAIGARLQPRNCQQTLDQMV